MANLPLRAALGATAHFTPVESSTGVQLDLALQQAGLFLHTA